MPPGLQDVQQRITSEVSSLAGGSNPLLGKFARETKVYPLIETLGAATDLGELEAAASVDDNAEATHERLTGEVNALRADALDALLPNAQQAERELRRLSGLLSTIKSFDAGRYDAAVAAVTEAEQRRAEAREQLFNEDELPGQPDEEWQQFVASGDTYRQHLGHDEYPQDGDACLYCTQPLSATAIDLLTRYRTFLDETLVQQLTTAQTTLTAARLALDESELSRAKEYVTDLAREDEAPHLTTAVAKVLVNATIVRTEAAKGLALSVPSVAADAASVASEVDAALGAAKILAAQLATDKANSAVALATKQKELAELTSRIELEKNLATAREYVRRAKRAQQLEKVSGARSPAVRASS